MERGPVQLNIPRDMFYGDLETKIPAASAIEKSAGGSESLKRAAELLLSAKNPVVVSGEFLHGYKFIILKIYFIIT